MKKFYVLLAVGTVAVSANAQRVSGLAGFNGHLNTKKLTVNPNANRAAGDTLFFTEAEAFYGTGIDGTFAYTTEDIDGLPSNMTNNFPSPDWGNFYSLLPYDFFPEDVDTAYYFAATSWFNSPGQAHNWIEFGPINIPATGATVSWYVKTNPNFRDGYEVLINTTGLSSFDFVDPAIYTRTDLYPSSATDAIDTVFQMFSATLPASYNGMPIYLGFHHNAVDMDVIYLDNILVAEGAATSVNEVENALFVSEVFPNPSNAIASFTVNAKEAGVVNYTITDLSGRVVTTKAENIGAGMNTISFNANALAAGIYNLNVMANGAVVTKKVQIIK